MRHLLEYYLPLADSALVIDNSSDELLQRPIARKNINGSLEILDKGIWKRIEQVAYAR